MCLRVAIFLPSPVPRPSARRSPCDRGRKSAQLRTTSYRPRAAAWSHHSIFQTRTTGARDSAAQRRSVRWKSPASPLEDRVTPLVALLLLAGLPVRTLSLGTSTPGKPVRVACPRGQTTRIVFPEPFLPGGVRVSRGATDAMGIVLEASRPAGVIAIRPENHPASGTVTLRGPSVLVTLVLWTAAEGIGSEIRVIVPGPSDSSHPAAAPADPADRSRTATAPAASGDRSKSPSTLLAGRGGVATTGGASETPQSLPVAKPPSVVPADDTSHGTATADPGPIRSDEMAKTASIPLPGAEGTSDPAPSAVLRPIAGEVGHGPSAQETLDLEGLLLARPEHIGRREGLPGQPPLTLDDALKSDAWVWLRFTLPGGAASRIEEVSWENGLIRAYQTQPVKSDLRIVVQLPRARVTKRTRITVKVAPGGSYKFALSAPWLSTFVRGLF